MKKPAEGSTIYRFDNGVMRQYKIREWKGNKAKMVDGTEMIWHKDYGFIVRNEGNVFLNRHVTY